MVSRKSIVTVQPSLRPRTSSQQTPRYDLVQWVTPHPSPLVPMSQLNVAAGGSSFNRLHIPPLWRPQHALRRRARFRERHGLAAALLLCVRFGKQLCRWGSRWRRRYVDVNWRLGARLLWSMCTWKSSMGSVVLLLYKLDEDRGECDVTVCDIVLNSFRSSKRVIY